MHYSRNKVGSSGNVSSGLPDSSARTEQQANESTAALRADTETTDELLSIKSFPSGKAQSFCTRITRILSESNRVA